MSMLEQNKQALNRARAELAQVEARARDLKSTLARAESMCQHEWENSTKLVETTEGVIDWANPTKQGVHLDYPTKYVPVTKTAYTRECSRCGKVEQTFETRDKTVQEPAFR